ncbi:MAG: ATP-binding protein [Bacillota bacterium]|nr:ATP-binding protein [Bacillota bacterium]
MKRIIYDSLLSWKNDPNRKPLIIDGARQVGKTWILKKFGEKEFKNTAYINCDKTAEMKSAFYDFDVKRLIRVFSSIAEETITPGETLIILDEIQEVPIGLTALKYFCEEAREYHIVVAGSLLGISLHEGSGFPVGKVDEMKMYPMSFLEFVQASGRQQLLKLLKSHKWQEISSMSISYIDLLRQYYYVGGMPEVVNSYFENNNLNEVRIIQNRILKDYEQDFSKHIPQSLLSKVNMVWNSIPSQLAKENKKFVYGALKKGGRAKEFEDAIEWLIKAGLIYKVTRTKKIEKPLKFYEDFNSFKLFVCDLGLLGAMSDVSAKDVITGEKVFSIYKGAFTEQYVAQELISIGEKIYYYSKENSNLEIDFLIQKDDIYPIEVKAEENVRSKSLRMVWENNPELIACRLSMSGYRDQEWMRNIPLYAVSEWFLSN